MNCDTSLTCSLCPRSHTVRKLYLRLALVLSVGAFELRETFGGRARSRDPYGPSRPRRVLASREYGVPVLGEAELAFSAELAINDRAERTRAHMCDEFDRLDATDKSGIAAVLNRCRVLAAKIVNELGNGNPDQFLDELPLADIHASLERAADVLSTVELPSITPDQSGASQVKRLLAIGLRS
jgi:hypothetical protein